jgi:hypothetical protein
MVSPALHGFAKDGLLRPFGRAISFAEVAAGRLHDSRRDGGATDPSGRAVAES